MMKITIRPYRFLYCSILSAIALILYGMDVMLLVALATVDATPRKDIQ